MAKATIKRLGATLDSLEITPDNFATEETLNSVLLALKFLGGIATAEETAQLVQSNKINNFLRDILGHSKDVEKEEKVVRKGILGKAASSAGPMKSVSSSVGILFSSAGPLEKFFMVMHRLVPEILEVVGVFALFAEGAKIIEKWNESMISVTNIGATFNGNLASFVVGAADAGLSIQKFTEVITKSATDFAAFGTVQQGVTTYSKIAQRTMMDYTDQLANMGISMDQYSQELPKILSLFAPAMKAHGASLGEITAATVDLTAQFQSMAELTGKSREQQAADLQAMTADAAWQMKMTNMSKDESEKYLKNLSEVRSTMGEGYAKLYKLSVLGIVPLDKSLQILLATTPGLGRSFNELNKLAQNHTIDTATYNTKMNGVMADAVDNAIRSGKSYETMIQAAAAGMANTPAELAKYQTELLAGKQEFYKNGVFDKKLFQAKLEEIQKANQMTNSLSKLNTVFSIIIDHLYTKVVGPILTKLQPHIEAFVNKLGSKESLEKIDKFIDGIISMGKGIVSVWPVLKAALIVLAFLAIPSVIMALGAFTASLWKASSEGLVGIVAQLGKWLWAAISPMITIIGWVAEAFGTGGLAGAITALELSLDALLAPIAAIFWPVTLVVIGVVALGTAIYGVIKYWDNIKAWFESLKPYLGYFTFFLDLLKSTWQDFLDVLAPFGKFFQDVMNYIGPGLKILKEFLGSALMSALKYQFGALLLVVGVLLLPVLLLVGLFKALFWVIKHVENAFKAFADWIYNWGPLKAARSVGHELGAIESKTAGVASSLWKGIKGAVSSTPSNQALLEDKKKIETGEATTGKTVGAASTDINDLHKELQKQTELHAKNNALLQNIHNNTSSSAKSSKQLVTATV